MDEVPEAAGSSPARRTHFSELEATRRLRFSVACIVAGVVDGDTIDVDFCPDSGRVRLILIDTPEVFGGAECYGQEASDYTKARLSVGESVQLERDLTNRDSFGRSLRYVWADGELFNLRIVLDGYAALAVYPPDTKYQAPIAEAEGQARLMNRGL